MSVPHARAHRGPAWGKLALIALVVVGLSALWRYTPLHDVLAPRRLFGWAKAFGDRWWAPFVVIAAFTPAAFVMFPRQLITLFAVVGFGALPGALYSLVGILLAALASYYAGRALPHDTVRRLGGTKVDEMSEVLRRRGLAAVFAVRIIPVAPFVIEGLIAGRIPIRLWHFMLGTLLGMLPGTLTTAVFGGQIANALEEPARINWWLVTLVLVLFVLLTLYVKHWFGREQESSRRTGRG